MSSPDAHLRMSLFVRGNDNVSSTSVSKIYLSFFSFLVDILIFHVCIASYSLKGTAKPKN